ncbi:MAG: M48 family metalloprotease [Ferruginibacter sp.]
MLIFRCFLFSYLSFGQDKSYQFSPLSSDVFKDRINTYKQRNAPIVYTDKKKQKSYAEILKERNEDLVLEFEGNELLYDTMLLNKCNNILTNLKKSNPTYSFDSIKLFINRSCIGNACCYGEGTLFVNLGLFLWMDNDDELALVVGHEIAHQLLSHSEKKIMQNIDLFSSDEFKAEIKSIKKSNDSKYKGFKAILKDMTVQTGTHSRYKESEADSLGAVLIKNAGYDISKAAPSLLKLDSINNLYTENNFYNVKNIFEKSVSADFAFVQKKKYNGLSNEVVTMNAEEDIDTVRTHPDCRVRFNAISKGLNISNKVNCCSAIDDAFKDIKERALVEIIRHEYEHGNLTRAIHQCLFAMQNGFTNPYFNYMISMSFSKIYEADLILEKFSVTNAAAKPGSTLKALQDFIFNANRENLLSIAAYFLQNNTDKNIEEYFFANMMYKKASGAPDASAAANTFKTKFPSSKYNYILNPTKKTK